MHSRRSSPAPGSHLCLQKPPYCSSCTRAADPKRVRCILGGRVYPTRVLGVVVVAMKPEKAHLVGLGFLGFLGRFGFGGLLDRLARRARMREGHALVGGEGGQTAVCGEEPPIMDMSRHGRAPGLVKWIDLVAVADRFDVIDEASDRQRPDERSWYRRLHTATGEPTAVLMEARRAGSSNATR